MIEEKRTFLRGAEVFYRKSEKDGNKHSLILLHGMSFTSKNWAQIDAFDILSNAGFNVYSPDFPGFGNSMKNSEYEITRNFSKAAEFITDFAKELGIFNFSIVGPSMGGGIVLSALLNNKNMILSGIVIGAAGISTMNEKLRTIETPLLIFWGENDFVISKEQGKILHDLVRGSELIIVPEAGHALYLEKPSVFFKEIIRFLKEKL
ncbi:MAG: alpha/beta fold hydrolase [Thermoplasmataceae archaeon]